jgi:predicted phosphoribosyltransferase
MRFENRTEAGRALAAAIALTTARPYVVAAVPRGGVAVALPIAERLAVPLTISHARKLTVPRRPGIPFGALDEDGRTVLDSAAVAGLRISDQEIEAARARAAAEIERQVALYRVPRLARCLPGPAVLFVDDGLASGLTMQAAVEYARRHGAREVAVAVPCAARLAVRRLRAVADHVVAVVVDEAFTAIADHYVDFTPVLDDEVIAMLARAAEHVPGCTPAPGTDAPPAARG